MSIPPTPSSWRSTNGEPPYPKRNPPAQSKEARLLEDLRLAMQPTPPPASARSTRTRSRLEGGGGGGAHVQNAPPPLLPQRPATKGGGESSSSRRSAVLRDYDQAIHTNLVRDAYTRLSSNGPTADIPSRIVLGPPAYNSPQQRASRESLLPSIFRRQVQSGRPATAAAVVPGAYSSESAQLSNIVHRDDSKSWRESAGCETVKKKSYTPKPPAVYSSPSIDVYSAKFELACEMLQEDEIELRNILVSREKFELEIAQHLLTISLEHDVLRPALEGVQSAERSGRASIHTRAATDLSRIREQHSRLRAGLAVKCIEAKVREQDVFVDDGSAESIITRLAKMPYAREKAFSVRDAKSAEGAIAAAASTSLTSSRVLPPRENNNINSGLHFTTAPLDAELASPLMLSETSSRQDILLEQSTHFDVLIVGQWQDAYSKIATIDNRKAHLIRLQQWRSDREQKDRRAALAVAISNEMVSVVEREQAQRRAIQFQEDDAFFDDLLEEEKNDVSCIRRARVESMEAEARSINCVLPYWDDLTVIVECGEEAGREWLCTYLYQKTVVRPLEAKFEDLCDLLHINKKQHAAVLKLQRMFRKIRHGLGGWRRTHRQIGQELLQSRSVKAMRRAQAPLIEYRDALYEEGWDITEEVFQVRDRAYQAVLDDEAAYRICVVENDEAWARQRIEGQIVTDIMFNIMLPRRRALWDEIEPAARNAIREEHFVKGLWGPTFGHFEAKLSILARKEALLTNEVPAFIDSLTFEEQHFRSRLHVEYLLGVEAVIRRQEDRDNEMMIIRDCLEQTETKIRHLIEKEEVAVANKCISERNESYFMESMRRSVRSSIVQPSAVEFTSLFSNFATERHELYGDAMLRDYTLGILWSKKHSMEEGVEPHLRACIAIEENAAWNHFKQVFVPESLFDLFQYIVRKEEAASQIQSMYRNVKQGGIIGRSGTRAYLSKVFQPKRERHAFYRHMDTQRENLEDLKACLAEEITHHVHETSKEFVTIFERLETVETRCRVRIFDEALFFLQLVQTNSHTLARETVLQQLRDLWQQESYWRYRVSEEHQTIFDTVFKTKKATFTKDVKIRAGQRAWRCYKARQVYKEKVVTGISTIQLTEANQRAEIAKEALIPIAIGSDYLPVRTSTQVKRSGWAPVSYSLPADGGITSLYWSEFMNISMTALLNHECFVVGYSQLVEDETIGRIGILSTMQGAIRIGEIEEDERAERVALYRNIWDFMLDELELSETETCERQAIEREYFNMMLKCVVSQSERERAELIRREYSIAYVRDICCFEGEAMTRGAYLQEEASDMRSLVLQTATGVLSSIMTDETTLRSRLYLEHTEERARLLLENQRDSLQHFFFRLVGAQESQQRFRLYREEVTEVELGVLLPWKELYGRYLLERRWATTGPFKEEDLDFGTM